MEATSSLRLNRLEDKGSFRSGDNGSDARSSIGKHACAMTGMRILWNTNSWEREFFGNSRVNRRCSERRAVVQPGCGESDEAILPCFGNVGKL